MSQLFRLPVIGYRTGIESHRVPVVIFIPGDCQPRDFNGLGIQKLNALVGERQII